MDPQHRIRPHASNRSRIRQRDVIAIRVVGRFFAPDNNCRSLFVFWKFSFHCERFTDDLDNFGVRHIRSQLEHTVCGHTSRKILSATASDTGQHWKCGAGQSKASTGAGKNDSCSP